MNSIYGTKNKAQTVTLSSGHFYFWTWRTAFTHFGQTDCSFKMFHTLECVLRAEQTVVTFMTTIFDPMTTVQSGLVTWTHLWVVYIIHQNAVPVVWVYMYVIHVHYLSALFIFCRFDINFKDVYSFKHLTLRRPVTLTEQWTTICSKSPCLPTVTWCRQC